MKASLAQSSDWQVKCNILIEFGATRRRRSCVEEDRDVDDGGDEDYPKGLNARTKKNFLYISLASSAKQHGIKN